MGGTGLPWAALGCYERARQRQRLSAGFRGRDSVSKGCQMGSNDWLSVAKGGDSVAKDGRTQHSDWPALVGPGRDWLIPPRGGRGFFAARARPWRWRPGRARRAEEAAAAAAGPGRARAGPGDRPWSSPSTWRRCWASGFCVVDQHLRPAGRGGTAKREELEQQLRTVIDELGKASAKAQGLSTPVTSAARMESNRHVLYILRDTRSPKGAVARVSQGGLQETFPAAPGARPGTLPGDAAAGEGAAREAGRGQTLGKAPGVPPKHFGLCDLIPQVNNFVIFEGFFSTRTVPARRPFPRPRPEEPIKPYSLTERDFLREEPEPPWPFNLSRGSPVRGSLRPFLLRRETPAGTPPEPPPRRASSLGRVGR
ncbi:alpha-tubulin N-acetyltransferase 1 isoform X2 [Corvus hawaiiensis]|uniref:alpha-tubulin N-acetyltransferase 1 isoform X2 n=1 Tax=Corvus hawaiiensis TaxID=134902 RepID=UPI0020192A7B|nr:alpha-tubulin N-acetyltransferase 1 isoform X2 [Corvus hawaiiensis]